MRSGVVAKATYWNEAGKRQSTGWDSEGHLIVRGLDSNVRVCPNYDLCTFLLLCTTPGGVLVRKGTTPQRSLAKLRKIEEPRERRKWASVSVEKVRVDLSISLEQDGDELVVRSLQLIMQCTHVTYELIGGRSQHRSQPPSDLLQYLQRSILNKCLLCRLGEERGDPCEKRKDIARRNKQGPAASARAAAATPSRTAQDVVISTTVRAAAATVRAAVAAAAAAGGRPGTGRTGHDTHPHADLVNRRETKTEAAMNTESMHPEAGTVPLRVAGAHTHTGVGKQPPGNLIGRA